MTTNIWDHIAAQAHRLLTSSRPRDLTPAVVLVRSLHPTPPATPAAVCAHLDTATTVLPALARHAAAGDRHALLMAAALMRHPLRRIADMADPDAYYDSDRDARDNDTLTTFFTVIRTCAEPHILTARYLYGAVLRRTLAARQTGHTTAAIRLEPGSPILDRTDHGPHHNHTAALLDTARDTAVITPLEHTTLTALYLHANVLDPTAAAVTLNASPCAVARRAQRAIRKLQRHYSRSTAVAA